MSLETVGNVYRNLQSKVPLQLNFIQSVETGLYESDVSSISDPIINLTICLEGARTLDVVSQHLILDFSSLGEPFHDGSLSLSC